MLILVDNWPGGGAIQCQRAITNRTNVVVDVLACSPSVGSAGWTIARDVGQKITGQR
jgi:serine/threonine-protein kinase